jgi:hypothetical protein
MGSDEDRSATRRLGKCAFQVVLGLPAHRSSALTNTSWVTSGARTLTWRIEARVGAVAPIPRP